MNIVTISVDDKGLQRARNFEQGLGMALHNIAVMLAPYDTGNLRSAISVPISTQRKIVVDYNFMVANYIKFLELGEGNVKKHKGFISIDTHAAFVEVMTTYIQTGYIPPFKSAPVVEMRSTSKIFSQEYDILKGIDRKSNEISPQVRRQISMIRETAYRKQQGIDNFKIPRKNRISTIDFHLKSPTNNKTLYKSISHGSNKGISELRKIYRKLRES